MIGSGTWLQVYDIGGNFNDDSDVNEGTFTAPETGKYLFTGTVEWNNIPSGMNTCFTDLVTSNRVYRQKIAGKVVQDASSEYQPCFSYICDMDADDTAYIRVTGNGGAKTCDFYGDSASIYTNFAGALLA